MIYISKLFSPISTGTSAGDIDVGATVKINENGQAVDYLVVNQGIPNGSDLYDQSCNGTWIFKKDSSNYIGTTVQSFDDMMSQHVSIYESVFGPDIIEAAMPARIPFFQESSGTANHITSKIFPLSTSEIGLSEIDDGAKLSYFDAVTPDETNNKAIAGFELSYLIRLNYDTAGISAIMDNGGRLSIWDFGVYIHLRPALILPYSFKFKEVS